LSQGYNLDSSRADKLFIFLPELALAGGTGPCFDFFRSLFQAGIDE